MPQAAKKILMVIAFRDFRDPEYFIPKTAFEKAGFIIKTASNKEGIAVGADGGEAEVDVSIKDIDINGFNAVVFIGGAGCLKYLDNNDSYSLIKKAAEKKLFLAAICISPVILAKAGVLKGKRATIWSGPMAKEPIAILKANGALYQEAAVVVDGNIITANGPEAAIAFAETIIKHLRATP